VQSDIDKPSINPESFQELKHKSLAGMGALFVRQILVKVIFFIGNIVLARILAPHVFGIYAIVQFVVQFFSTFGDVGIGAALIQKKGELTREELSTTFWLQQMLVWLVVGIGIVAAPLALKVYPTLPPVGVWLIRAMAISFLLSSLKTIPAILMERDIDFKRIAWVDITENLAFQAVAISCAFMGLDVWSFILAAITRSLLGTVIIYALSPWRPSFQYRFESVKGLVRFGLPYQANGILGFIKDAVTPLFVGAYAGAAAVGYVNWAKNVAFAPLMISESFGRVAFPAFSKLQDDKELLVRTVERSIRMITLVMFPITAIMVSMGPEITHVVFTDKWMPGIRAFYFFCTTPLIIGIMLPMYSAILSLGKSAVILKMTGLLLLLEWGLGVPFVVRFGFTGIAFNQPILSLFFLYVYSHVLKAEGVRIKIFQNINWQLGAAVVAGLLSKYCISCITLNILTLAIAALAGTVMYAGILYVLRKPIVQEFSEYLLKAAGKRQGSL
jgi:O-antigen/teichoic acid export membrane protein